MNKHTITRYVVAAVLIASSWSLTPGSANAQGRGTGGIPSVEEKLDLILARLDEVDAELVEARAFRDFMREHVGFERGFSASAELCGDIAIDWKRVKDRGVGAKGKTEAEAGPNAGEAKADANVKVEVTSVRRMRRRVGIDFAFTICVSSPGISFTFRPEGAAPKRNEAELRELANALREMEERLPEVMLSFASEQLYPIPQIPDRAEQLFEAVRQLQPSEAAFALVLK